MQGGLLGWVMIIFLFCLLLLLLTDGTHAADGDPCLSSFGTVSAAASDTDEELCGSPAAYTTTTTTAVVNCAAAAISSATVVLTSAANFDTTGGSAAICNTSGVCNNFTYTGIAGVTMSGIANDANGGLTTCTGNYATGSRVYAMTTATNLARRLRVLMTGLQSAQQFIGEVNTTCAGKTAEGQACWNTTSELLSVGDGAALDVLASGDASGNATGVACTACITLTTEVTGLLPLANGGTNANLTAVNGGVLYSTATAGAISAAGTLGQGLISGGAGAPTWFAPTAGSVLFAGTGGILQQDNANFFFDDSNNRQGVGTTSPDMQLNVSGALTTTARGVGIDQYSTDTVEALLQLRKGRGTEAAPAAVGANDYLGGVTFWGYDGVNGFEEGARIRAIVAAAAGNADMPSSLVFEVSADGSASPTEGMRLDSTRALLVGTTVLTGSNAGDVVLPNNRALHFVNAAGTTSANFFFGGNTSNDLVSGVPAITNVHKFQFVGTDRLQFAEENSGAVVQLIGRASADLAVAAANQVKIYSLPDAGGDTELRAIFDTGVSRCIVSEDGTCDGV